MNNALIKELCILIRNKVIEIKNVTKSYGPLTVLHDVSLTVPEGEIMAIVGPSGAGKTTLLQIAGTLDRPDSGKVLFDGTDLFSLKDKKLSQFRNLHIGFVFQFHQLLPEFSALENVAMPALIAGRKKKEAFAEAERLLGDLGLGHRLSHKPAELSGGEKQRLALARAFLKDANLYILDESTSSLDFGTENTIFDMIYNQLADHSMLIVAHRLSTIRDCDLILVMDHGEIVERGTHEELLAKQGKYYELWSLQQGIFRNKKKAEQPAPAAAAKVVEDEDDGESITY